jgi:hypothetical protein
MNNDRRRPADFSPFRKELQEKLDHYREEKKKTSKQKRA